MGSGVLERTRKQLFSVPFLAGDSCNLQNITDTPVMFNDYQENWVYEPSAKDTNLRTVGPSAMFKQALKQWRSGNTSEERKMVVLLSLREMFSSCRCPSFTHFSPFIQRRSTSESSRTHSSGASKLRCGGGARRRLHPSTTSSPVSTRSEEKITIKCLSGFVNGVLVSPRRMEHGGLHTLSTLSFFWIS